MDKAVDMSAVIGYSNNAEAMVEYMEDLIIRQGMGDKKALEEIMELSQGSIAQTAIQTIARGKLMEGVEH